MWQCVGWQCAGSVLTYICVAVLNPKLRDLKFSDDGCRWSVASVNRFKAVYEFVLASLAERDGVVHSQRLFQTEAEVWCLAEVAGDDVVVEWLAGMDAMADYKTEKAKRLDTILKLVMAKLSGSREIFAHYLAVDDVPQLDSGGCWHWLEGSMAVPVLAELSERQRVYCLAGMESEGLLLRGGKRKKWKLPAFSWQCLQNGYRPRALLDGYIGTALDGNLKLGGFYQV